MNKYFKTILSIILPIVILFGGVGCMNQNNSKDIVKEKMHSYACDKYNQDFEIINFEFALRGLDSNRRDILKIKDINGVEFNVFHYTDDKDYSELYDDYPSAIVDDLFTDKLNAMPEFFGLDYAVTISLDLGYESLYYEDVKDSSLGSIFNKFNLYQITLVIICQERSIKLSEKIYEFYSCYSKLQSFNPERIDFEVIKTNGNDNKLEDSLSNIRIEYENDWNTFKSVDEYISVLDKNITFDEFEKMIVKV